MPKLDLDAIDAVNRTGYPPPHDKAVEGRWQRRFATASGLTRLGANHVVLKPGAWTSQRHWHDHADELVVMLEGEAVLVEDEGETVLGPGDIAVFPGGVPNGHVIQNRSDSDCVLLAVSAGHEEDSGEYSDIDMRFGPEGFTHKDGTPY
ncbi:cupin domain-containing protein [Alteraurantiacibacter aquimixticola]|uniref:Cupin domain-containing protein n=1 Tax=Alteraurantiacibacter aquimixticola TaxID=2489173 RepID=A0A4T3F6K2_9SPHN|nr:cupin domain-containing protein [Alteraurantiacibacter aquimixticola]TIX52074.1 cupin domain-containing protein [Alteraurantiacibacter aquimixticola]